MKIIKRTHPWLMFPNKRVEDYYQLCEKALSFSELSWWIIDLEDDSDIFYCNREMCKTFSLDQSAIQHSVSNFCSVYIDCQDSVTEEKLAKVIQGFDAYDQLKRGSIDEYCTRLPYCDSASGETSYFSSRTRTLLRNDAGNASLLLGIIEPELTGDELYKQATVDSLTGLKNRQECDSQLSFLINLAIRENHNISLVMCDVDDFNQYSELLGYDGGDECLVKISQSISDVCRRSSDITCRYSRDKFAVITYGNAYDALFLAHTLRERICALAIPHPAKDNAPVTVSIGYCSLIPDADNTPSQLIEWAESALHRAKSNGGNACAEFKAVEPEERFAQAIFS